MPSDPFSAYTHLAGAIVFGALAIPLILRARRNHAHPVGNAVFALSSVVLLLASTLYHTLPHATIPGDVARRLDHAAIFVLIAGTFTPIHLLLFRGVLRWGVLVLIWGCAAVGIALKLVYFESIPGWLHVLAYVAMGWLGAIGATVAIKRRGWRFMAPIGIAALAYTGGAMIELASWPVLAPGLGAHEIFHVMVLVGLGAFWWFIWRLAGGAEEPIAWRVVAEQTVLAVALAPTGEDDEAEVVVVASQRVGAESAA